MPKAGAGLDFDALVREAAATYMIPEQLLRAVIQTESGTRQNVVSPKGAVGYGQLMPGTASYYGADPHDPIDNVATTAMHLSRLISKYGDVNTALAAYNAGEGVVNKAGGIPNYPETLGYINKVNQFLTKQPVALVSGTLPVAGPRQVQTPTAPIPVTQKASAYMDAGMPVVAATQKAITEGDMQVKLREIAQHMAPQQNIDLSRQYEERSPYSYGTPDTGIGDNMTGVAAPAPAPAPMMRMMPPPLGLSWLKPTGGLPRTFTDYTPSER